MTRVGVSGLVIVLRVILYEVAILTLGVGFITAIQWMICSYKPQSQSFLTACVYTIHYSPPENDCNSFLSHTADSSPSFFLPFFLSGVSFLP